MLVASEHLQCLDAAAAAAAAAAAYFAESANTPVEMGRSGNVRRDHSLLGRGSRVLMATGFVYERD